MNNRINPSSLLGAALALVGTAFSTVVTAQQPDQELIERGLYLTQSADCLA